MKRTVDVSIPLGPIHPCFKEPARVKCETKGEYVIAAEVELGYMKKGIERIMRGQALAGSDVPCRTGLRHLLGHPQHGIYRGPRTDKRRFPCRTGPPFSVSS